MFVKRAVVMLTAVIMLLLPAAACFAQDDIALSQACAWDQSIDIYIAGDINVESLSLKVSNQLAEVTDGGLLTDKGVTVRTTILIDISTSIPSQMRGQITSYIEMLIENISKNEQYRLITFGETLEVLQDFTSDRYDLAKAAGKMAFTGKKSMIYDAIYNTIPKVQPIDGMPCYYRTMVITDGVDDTESGITKEELYLKLQADHYPIDVIAVSAEKKTDQIKELAALVRMSSGRYFHMNQETDLQVLSEDISVSDTVWLRAAIPTSLLDGSTRQFDISDGVHSVQFDFKAPVFETSATGAAAPDTASDEENDAASPDAAIAQPTQKDNEGDAAGADSKGKGNSDKSKSNKKSDSDRSASDEDDEDDDESGLPLSDIFGEYTIAVYIGAGIAVVVLIAVFIAVAAVKGKKKKQGSNNAADKAHGKVSSQNTEIIGSNSSNGAVSAGPSGSLCVRLRNINNPDQIWEIGLTGGILIGRDTECQICIDEKSMSRRQCRLYLDDNGVPMAENLSSANITQLNAEPLTAPRRISERDRLKCGRVTLVIDSLYGASSGNVGNINKMTEFVNV